MPDPARGRDAFERRAWREAYRLLAAAEALDADDLERLAVAAYVVGDEQASEQAWQQAHAAYEVRRDRDGAGRCAVRLGMLLFLRGEVGHAGGWFARAEHLASEAAGDADPIDARGVDRFALVAGNVQALMRGDMEAARSLAAEMVAIGRRAGDHELLVWGLMCLGEAEVALGETGRGLQRLDEAMLLLASGDLPPLPAGIVYCAAIDACMAAFDLRRATEWTAALTTWCSAQPDLVPFRGQCLVHRSQLHVARGAWTDAAVEVEQARRRLTEASSPALALACYQQGEIHRLRGELHLAERAYHEAAAAGHDPAPGLALLRLAAGDADAAAALIRRMVEEHRNSPTRPVILQAAVEVLLAGGDVDGARAASAELDARSTRGSPPLLGAIADHARGLVLLAENDAGDALACLRRACRTFRDLDLPYDAARTEVQIAAACTALADAESAALALDAARATFERLGAATDLASIDRPRSAQRDRPAGRLTERELEVLRLVAAGKANREIAAALMISPHTVGRHLQNIFMKLGLSSRAAATAYAYRHGLT